MGCRLPGPGAAGRPQVQGLHPLPLIFLKRLSDVFEDEFRRLVEEFGDEEVAVQVVEGDRKAVRFYVPEEARRVDPRNHRAVQSFPVAGPAAGRRTWTPRITTRET